MAYRHIEVTRLAGGCGAEVAGVDLAQPLDAAVVGEIRRAIVDNLVLFFRGQAGMRDADQVRFASYFGSFGRDPFVEGEETHPNVIHRALRGHERAREPAAAGLPLRPRRAARVHLPPWSPGALAMWDNRCLQHFAINDYSGHRRELRRTTVLGEAPIPVSAAPAAPPVIPSAARDLLRGTHRAPFAGDPSLRSG